MKTAVEELVELIDDMTRLMVIATTANRDVSPDDNEWFRTHPLRTALNGRGVISSHVAAAAVIEWLGDRLEAMRGAEPENPYAPARDAMWVIPNDAAPTIGDVRTEWGLQATEGVWIHPPIFECEEDLARHIDALDVEFQMVTRTRTAYSDTVSPWHPHTTTENGS